VSLALVLPAQAQPTDLRQYFEIEEQLLDQYAACVRVDVAKRLREYLPEVAFDRDTALSLAFLKCEPQEWAVYSWGMHKVSPEMVHGGVQERKQILKREIVSGK
jgi:hypothetical protein